jgi:eukaryotic-like serine/threonine-protein kinase
MNASIEDVPGPSMPFVAGTLVAGKYRIERPLGQGGMGHVVLARHVQLDQPVALKFMHAWLANESPECAARFLGEARAAARIRSDHVARVSDTGTLEDGSPYMVMEYLEGQDLEALLQQQRRRMPVSLAIAYAMQAAEGLGEAHASGIIHRDLKPSNLFLARQTDGSIRVKLLDFGISKMVAGANGATELGDATWVHGSPLYMAPERMRSPGNADHRADIWALGVVLYEMLAATPPFVGDTVEELCEQVFGAPPLSLRMLRADVPAVLDAAVMQCLEKDPRHRFQSVAALARALAPFGTLEARAAAARIDRIVHGRDPRIERARSEPTRLAAAVPERPLTRTSFSRAVDRVADVVRPTGPEGIEGRPVADSSADASEVTLTPAPFSHAIRASTLKGARSKLAFVAAGALVIGAAVLLLGATTSSKNSTSPAQPRANAARATSPILAATQPSPTEVAAASPTEVAAPSATEVAAPSAARAPSPPAASTAKGRKPKPEAAATSKTAPIGTSGFGGRE